MLQILYVLFFFSGVSSLIFERMPPAEDGRRSRWVRKHNWRAGQFVMAETEVAVRT